MRVLTKVLIIILIAAGGAVAVYGKPNSWLIFSKPCSKPLEYSLATFDSKFKVTEQDFFSAIDEAVQIWEKSVNKDLFVFKDDGRLQINLIYDSRQEATDRLKGLGIRIETTRASYDNLKNVYGSQISKYNTQKSELESLISGYNTRKATYEQEVNYWNSRGGAPKSEYEKLRAEQAELNELAQTINQKQNQLNVLVDDINATVNALNTIAKQLNLNVSSYNNIGSSRGGEFEQGHYSSDQTGKRINIYEFSDRQQLVRLLAHELGHSLGLDHVEDPEAIMYRLNQSKNNQPTLSDILELKEVCRIE